MRNVLFTSACLLTLTAGSGFAVTPAPVYSVLSQLGVLGKRGFPTGGLLADPASPVAGAFITTFAYGTSKPGQVLMLTPNAGGTALSISVVHTFTGTDGFWPQGRLLPINGTLLGVTAQGGAFNGGVLYNLTPSGSSYSFQKLMDFGSTACPVQNPHGDLQPGYQGLLYGNSGRDPTTPSRAGGAIYALTPPATPAGGWSCTTIKGFDGTLSGPSAVTIAADGSMYYNVLGGGPHKYGDTEILSPPASANGPWTSTIVHSFASSKTDGHYPQSILTPDGNGDYLGVTTSGGTYHHGTMFDITPPVSGGSWGYQVLYNFAGGSNDADTPTHDLVQTAPGVYYGTSVKGGLYNLGTVYRLSNTGGSWTTSIVHSFAGGSTDGAKGGRLYLAPSGIMYGTTTLGALNNLGVVYSVTAP
jgi:uncharacterized repeat protein (TIGR03803 family)